MKPKSVVGVPGAVYRIPLFYNDVSPLQRFSKKDFPEGENRYSYCRVVGDKQGSGILVEVFKYVGVENVPELEIISSGLIFDPVLIIGDGIKRKRWVKVFDSEAYDAEKDSGKGLIEKRISEKLKSGVGVQTYSSVQLERLIVESLPDSVKKQHGIVLKELIG